MKSKRGFYLPFGAHRPLASSFDIFTFTSLAHIIALAIGEGVFSKFMQPFIFISLAHSIWIESPIQGKFRDHWIMNLMILWVRDLCEVLPGLETLPDISQLLLTFFILNTIVLLKRLSGSFSYTILSLMVIPALYLVFRFSEAAWYEVQLCLSWAMFLAVSEVFSMRKSLGAMLILLACLLQVESSLHIVLFRLLLILGLWRLSYDFRLHKKWLPYIKS